MKGERGEGGGQIDPPPKKNCPEKAQPLRLKNIHRNTFQQTEDIFIMFLRRI